MNLLRSTVVLIGVALLPALISAQAPPTADDPLDIDGLFEDEEDDDAGDSSDEQAPPSDPRLDTSSLLDRVFETDPVRMRATARIVAGYSPGWTEPLGEKGEFVHLPVIALSSGIDLLFTISPVLSVSQKFRFSYPTYTPTVSEFALEYSIADTAFLTLGLRRINWGRSPSFPHTNLLHRQADTPLSTPNARGTVIVRTAVPVGVGGFEFVFQNKPEYHENPARPDPARIGVGAKYNWARERLDLDVGAYYQSGLAGRAFVSGATTITDWLELYAEALIADSRLRVDDTGPYAGVDEPRSVAGEPLRDGWVEIAPGYILFDNSPDYSAAIGIVLGLFSNRLDLNAEYLYSGEETERRVAGSTFPLYWGHNFAANADLNHPDLPVRFRAGFRYNHTFRSSFFAPRITFDAARHVTLDLVGGFFWGPTDAGYRAANPDPADRPAFLTITATLNGRI